jgi:hypothetical protein
MRLRKGYLAASHCPSHDGGMIHGCYLILRHLEQARRHQSIGEMHLARQHEIIVELERDGHGTTEAKKLFAQFLVMQAMHIEHRRQLDES